jgi:hypothetical protein
MTLQRTKWLFVTLFRVLSFVAVALLCDFWFYTHMVIKWHALDQSNRTYWRNYVGHEWSVAEIKAVFGKPDSCASNTLVYTAFDFTTSETVFPCTEILLTRSLRHFQRHDVEFVVDDRGTICGYSESENDGSFRRYKERQPASPPYSEPAARTPQG